ncbi:MAG: hypothetical protein Q8J68_07200, partial [Methanolobus sp.]|uniref:hypothetical protein n=1 Tax=Methanolobus sp. TaxID=1874737 RepID=UPI002731D318
DQIESVTDAEGNEFEFAEAGGEINDNPFGDFITMITVMMDMEDHGFGDFITEITVSETGNMTGPITITFTDEWDGELPPNDEGHIIATDIQNIGEMGDDSAWITIGFCEATSSEPVDDTVPENETEADLVVTLQS